MNFDVDRIQPFLVPGLNENWPVQIPVGSQCSGKKNATYLGKKDQVSRRGTVGNDDCTSVCILGECDGLVNRTMHRYDLTGGQIGQSSHFLGNSR